MVNVRAKGYLNHIIKHCDKIISKVKDLTREECDGNEDYCDLICFHLLQIGELVKRLLASGSSFALTFPGVPWKSIARTRDKIAHGYETIDSEKVWGIALLDIPVLNEYCVSILGL